MTDSNIEEVMEDTNMDSRKEIYEWKDITSDFFNSVSDFFVTLKNWQNSKGTKNILGTRAWIRGTFASWNVRTVWSDVSDWDDGQKNGHWNDRSKRKSSFNFRGCCEGI